MALVWFSNAVMIRFILCRLLPVLLMAIVVMAGISEWSSPVTLGAGANIVTCSVGSLVLFSFALGMLTLGLRAIDELWNMRTKLNLHLLQKDKAQVTSETAQDKIVALENKIKTLEAALIKAIQ